MVKMPAISSVKVPDTFQEVEVSGKKKGSNLLKNAESIDNELWLVRTPSDFDVTTLNGQAIFLTGSQVLSTNEETGESIETISNPGNNLQGLSIVLPSQADNKCGKKLVGEVCVVKSLSVPSVSLSNSPTKRGLDIPSGLKVRFQPFGSESPISEWKKQKLEKAEIEPSSPRKKKKKKKKKSKRH